MGVSFPFAQHSNLPIGPVSAVDRPVVHGRFTMARKARLGAVALPCVDAGLAEVREESVA